MSYNEKLKTIKKGAIPIILLIIISLPSFGQQYRTRTGHLHVKSTNNVQNIIADDYQTACQFDASTGNFKIIALIKSFEYQLGAINRIMNTKEIDVSEYPRITYEGIVQNVTSIDFNKPGQHEVSFDGTLYIWNEKRITPATGQLIINEDGSLNVNSEFTITIEEANTKKIDNLIKEKLPSINVSTSTFGISRDIDIKAKLILKPINR